MLVKNYSDGDPYAYFDLIMRLLILEWLFFSQFMF